MRLDNPWQTMDTLHHGNHACMVNELMLQSLVVRHIWHYQEQHRITQNLIIEKQA